MSSSSSESDGETEKPQFSRLGECEVCGACDAVYSCPKCEVKTCSLKCVVIHKKELECDGIRDRTKFIRVRDFTDTDLLSDYRLLEECARFVFGVRRDEKKKFTRIDKDLPIHLFKLKMAARKRGIVLQFLAQNFTRHAINTTRYNYKTNVIHWRVELIFPNAESSPLKFVEEKCPEDVKLAAILGKYLNENGGESFEGDKALSFYRAAGFSGVKVLLKAEKVKGSSKKYFELDCGESLSANLAGKCVVEFPVVVVVLKDHAYNFDVVTPEDEFDYSKEKTTDEDRNLEDRVDKKIAEGKLTENTDMRQNTEYSRSRKPRQLLTEKIAEQKKREIEKEIKQDRKKQRKNLLFTTGYSSEEDMSDCEVLVD